MKTVEKKVFKTIKKQKKNSLQLFTKWWWLEKKRGGIKFWKEAINSRFQFSKGGKKHEAISQKYTWTYF